MIITYRFFISEKFSLPENAKKIWHRINPEKPLHDCKKYFHFIVKFVIKGINSFLNVKLLFSFCRVIYYVQLRKVSLKGLENQTMCIVFLHELWVKVNSITNKSTSFNTISKKWHIKHIKQMANGNGTLQLIDEKIHLKYIECYITINIDLKKNILEISLNKWLQCQLQEMTY